MGLEVENWHYGVDSHTTSRGSRLGWGAQRVGAVRVDLVKTIESVKRTAARAATDVEVDRALVAAIAGGDREALATLYDRHAAQMLAVARRVLGGRLDAEDLLHDVFLEAWSKASSYDSKRGSVRAWLLIRVRSRAIDRLRARRTVRGHAQNEARIAAPLEVVSRDPSALVDGARALEVLSTLPTEQRFVVELAYFEGLTLREIGERRGCPTGTVKSRMAAAIERLRRGLAVDRGEGS